MALSKKMIDHDLTVGSIDILKQILPTSEWYAKRSSDALQMINGALSLIEGPLSEVPAVPSPEAGERQEKYDARVAALVDEKRSIPMTESQRKAARECLRFQIDKGRLILTKHVGILIKELEVE